MDSHSYQHSYKIKINSRLCKVQHFETNEELWCKTWQYGRRAVWMVLPYMKEWSCSGWTNGNEIALKMEINFKWFNWWLQHFKKRQNIASHSGRCEDTSPVLDSAEKIWENVKPISIKYELKDISKQDKTSLFFYNAHPKTTVALKGMK